MCKKCSGRPAPRKMWPRSDPTALRFLQLVKQNIDNLVLRGHETLVTTAYSERPEKKSNIPLDVCKKSRLGVPKAASAYGTNRDRLYGRAGPWELLRGAAQGSCLGELLRGSCSRAAAQGSCSREAARRSRDKKRPKGIL